MKCDACLYGRPVVSENGIHYICCLSDKAAMKCLTGEKERFDKNPCREEGDGNG